ncbi:MAG: GNAT family N-acetyltransferase [Halobellus sp.]|uniref:GNAT family N-acetyltransferase n=1 Tax=Halobellus sp. TaxID=1979212 RepID=UPI0035D3E2A6
MGGSRSSDDDPNGVFVVETDAQRRDAFAVRRTVFVDEQGVDEAIEYDDYDDPGTVATHFVAYDDGEPAGAARLRPAGSDPDDDGSESDTAKAERVAVAADRRGEGWGRRIMRAVEDHARAEGFDRLALHAQTRVRAFYDKLGYEAYGEEFEEAGIPHIAMETMLTSDT